jgi:hypothetical protein
MAPRGARERPARERVADVVHRAPGIDYRVTGRPALLQAPIPPGTFLT